MGFVGCRGRACFIQHGLLPELCGHLCSGAWSGSSPFFTDLQGCFTMFSPPLSHCYCATPFYHFPSMFSQRCHQPEWWAQLCPVGFRYTASWNLLSLTWGTPGLFSQRPPHLLPTPACINPTHLVTRRELHLCISFLADKPRKRILQQATTCIYMCDTFK